MGGPRLMLASKRVARLKARGRERSEARAEIATKAAAYIRVSTEEQAQHGHGLDSQDKAVRAFAESQGYGLVHVAADPGVSGATRPAERAGFSELMRLAEAGAFSVLLVYKFDRLARQIAYAVTIVNELSERFGVVIRSVTEPIDTATPMGRTIFAVLAGMAEQERQAITERTWGGRREKATRGGFAGGMAPYGYARDRAGGLVVVEAEAAWVRRMFELRGEGLTLAAICERLDAEGAVTRRGHRWTTSGVGYVLDNPKYRGRVEYLFRFGGGEPDHVLKRGAHKAIVKPSH